MDAQMIFIAFTSALAIVISFAIIFFLVHWFMRKVFFPIIILAPFDDDITTWIKVMSVMFIIAALLVGFFYD